MKYTVVRKGNGKFAPRIDSAFGQCWFENPSEFESREEAVSAIMTYHEKKSKEALLHQETVIETLELF